MAQMILEAKSKTALKPFVQIARERGVVARYVPQREKKSSNPLNPSPSGDPWWDDPRNVAEVDAGLRDLAAGRVKRLEDCPEILELFAKYGVRRKHVQRNV